MTALLEFIRRLFTRVPSAVADEHCPYCYGLGYDASGHDCACLQEKKK
jgi:hypothetical protein